MKFRCCQSAVSSLIISDEALSFCCRFTFDKYAFLQNYNGETDFIPQYISARNKFIENCKKGITNYDICFNCSRFVEQDYDESIGIDYISLTARKKCSCNCIYCLATNGNTKKRIEFNKKEMWDIKPVLRYLEENKLLKKEGTLFIGAGECSEYPPDELKWLFEFALKNNFSIEIASSALYYSKEIEDILKTSRVLMLVSVDSGTKAVFERIKRVKSFDKVWNNLNNYITAAKDNSNAEVTIKYIIIDGINDDIDEFNEFINMCNKVNCKSIEISMDANYQTDKSVMNIEPTEKIKKLIFHIKNLNDKRIFFKSVIPVKEIKTTAREYSQNIADEILKGDTTVNAVVFSGKSDTYKKITGCDLFDTIWRNIASYVSISKKSGSFFSDVCIKYVIIPQKNDDISEIKSFLDLCSNLKINHIEFDLFNIKSLNLNNLKLESLKKAVSFIKKLNKSSIKISSALLSYINN